MIDFELILWILVLTLGICSIIVIVKLFPSKSKIKNDTINDIQEIQENNKISYEKIIDNILHLYAMSKAQCECNNIDPNCYMDTLLEEAAKFVISSQCAQMSVIQKTFSTDLLRAENIQKQLEFIGIISGLNEKSERKVLIKDVNFWRKPLSQIFEENLKEIKRRTEFYKLRIYKGMAKEGEKIKKENEEWDKKHRIICDNRLKAVELEKAGHIQEAINTYIENIKQCNLDPRFNNYQNTGYDINRVIILYSKTKQFELLRQFLEFNINKYPECASIQDWRVRLNKLNASSINIIIPNREDVVGIIKLHKENTIGKQLQQYKLNLPEFNFYYDLPEGLPTTRYQNLPNMYEIGVTLRKYREAFQIIKNEAMIAEQEGDYKTAIKAYEKMIKEEYENTLPYERLMILYKKIGWKDYEKSVIKRGIIFFSNLRDSQKNYVMTLARKYNMEYKAIEYINSNKKIFYYMGAFELYNPYPIIKKWEIRLDKLE